MTTQTRKKTELGYKNFLKILATKINLANVVDYDHFVYSILFDIEEPETYIYEMQGSNAAKYIKAIKEKLDQIYKNKTWELVYKNNIKPSYQLLKSKWIYKIKHNIDKNIPYFKAR